MKTVSKIILTILSFLFLFNFARFNINSNESDIFNKNELVRATVIKILKSDSKVVQEVKVIIREGKYKGKEFAVENSLISGNKLISLKENDNVMLIIDGDNEENLNIITYEYIRDKKIIYLGIFFVILVILVGGIKGIYALLSVGFTICVISVAFLPGLLSGYNPVKLTIYCSLIIALFSLIIQHGFSKKTFSSFIGTLGGVTAAGLVTIIMSSSLQVSVNSEEVTSLLRIPQKIDFNFQYILFASVVIGALGANIDMSMSVATAMNEVKQSNKHISKAEFIKCGMNVGRDVIGTMSNTLVLAYIGSSLVTLMIFMGCNAELNYVINLEDMCIEILRSLAGSVGIILSVPLTVFARAFMK
jgi:uncharacterized membrane protein